MTDAEFISWLRSPQRMSCILLEGVVNFEGSDVAFYMSDTGYTTSPTDSPSNHTYTDAIVDGGVIVEKISADGSDVTSMTIGDIIIDNVNGQYDYWYTGITFNKAVTMYVGDMSWPRADFRAVFVGLVDDIAPGSDRDHIAVKFKDGMQLIDSAITEELIGGTSVNATKLVPLLLGECFNLSCPLVSSATLQYQISGGTIERIIEVRDNGVPVDTTDDLADGSTELDAQSFGTVTISAQGEKYGTPTPAYVKTASGLIQLLVTTYGKTPLLVGQLDTAAFAAFATACPQTLGIYLTDTANVFEIVQSLASSVGAQVVMRASDNKLVPIIIAIPTSGGTAITAANMDEKTFQIIRRIPVKSGVRVRYCKNWTVQKGLQTGLPDEAKQLFQNEWLEAKSSNVATGDDYNISSEDSQPVETWLVNKDEAEDEAERRQELWGTQRHIYNYSGMPELMLEAIGGTQHITHARFNCQSGRYVQIVAKQTDWRKMKVDFEVLG